MNRETGGRGAAPSMALSQLFGLSGLLWFLQFALLRWVGFEVPLLAYHPHLMYLGFLFGLGAGCWRPATRRARAPLGPSIFLAAAALAAGRIPLAPAEGVEHCWARGTAGMSGGIAVGVAVSLGLAFFLLAAWTAFPWGKILREGFAGPSLPAYGAYLGGGLLGVLFSMAVNRWALPPWTALLSAGLAGLPFIGKGRPRAVHAGLAVLLGAMAAFSGRGAIHSPYYRIDTAPLPVGRGLLLTANHSLHQAAIPMGPPAGTGKEAPAVARAREGFHRPLAALRTVPKRALVLGAGLGNDVAALLVRGVPSIDAVEIDPVILAIGRSTHPDRPYQNPGVRCFTEDARTFLRRSTASYDLIVMGTVDSMTRFSPFVNLRLENYLYTAESFTVLRHRLAPGGGLIVYSFTPRPFVKMRLVALLARAFGELPVLLEGDYWVFNTALLAGPAFSHLRSEGRGAFQAEFERDIAPNVRVPTDDRPYVFTRHPLGDPVWAATVTALLAAAAIGLIGARRGGGPFNGGEAALFGWSAAYMFLQSVSLARWALWSGSTWTTESLSLFFQSALALAAVWTVRFRRVPRTLGPVGLLATLAVAVFVPPAGGASGGGLGLLAFAFYFSGIGFSVLFKDAASASRALAVSLLGSLAGGALANGLGPLTGLRGLLCAAFVLYAATLLLVRRRGHDQNSD